MKIGILGVGFIGSALKKYLSSKGVELLLNDPAQGFNDDLTNVETLFVCINVPNNSDGTQDTTILVQALESYRNVKNIFVRSTVLPGTCDFLAGFLKTNVWALPEFLTRATALEDEIKLPLVAGGGEQILENLFGKKVYLMKNGEAELTKYVHNCFGATKIWFFNIISKLCEQEELDYKKVREACQITGFIGDQWTHVPGPDGKYGFGGPCLPKDMQAFGAWSEIQPFRSILSDNDMFREESVAK